MTIHERIKADALAARKAKLPAAGVLTTLLGEMATKEKTFNPARPLGEDETVALVKKFVKNLDEAIAAVEQRPERAAEGDKLRAEKAALEGYLPQQLGAAQIEAFVRAQVTAGANLGGIMKALKDSHAGQYDGKLASEIAKRVVAEA